MAVLPREAGFHTNFIDIKAFIDPIRNTNASRQDAAPTSDLLGDNQRAELNLKQLWEWLPATIVRSALESNHPF
jgi:hypothetical protein